MVPCVVFKGAIWINKNCHSYGFNGICHNSVSQFESKKPFLCHAKYAKFCKFEGLKPSSLGIKEVINNNARPTCKAKVLDKEDVFPLVQTLRGFPVQEFSSKVVLVRFDSSILFQKGMDKLTPATAKALLTMKYLHDAGARIILISSWSVKDDSKILSVDDVAELLSSILQLKVVPFKSIFKLKQTDKEQFAKEDIILLDNLSNYKGEQANDPGLSSILASGVDIFVNDSFSSAHKILASTVGVTRFCYASLAGYHFEECLYYLKRITGYIKRPYVSVIGGSNIVNKAAALRYIASTCDGLVFVGKMAFQMMHAQGVPIPSTIVDHKVPEEAPEILEYAKSRNIPILLPKDFWCEHNSSHKHMETFPAHDIADGWEPVDVGPNSWNEIASFLSRCKKIMWIGPVKFDSGINQSIDGASKLALMLDELNQGDCDITVVGHMACEAVRRISRSTLSYNMIESASVVWEFLKGRNLPGLMALDKAFPFSVDWKAIYLDPTQPLGIDIGSGNGLFLTGMAMMRNDVNFLGLEINKKLVSRCLDSVCQAGPKNLHFIATNATSTFRTVVSSYPGPVILVSIQCPNPDFNEPEHRWRMVQRLLIEAIADLLTSEGKVFLQSDVEEVAMRMREQFLKDGKGKLAILEDDSNGGVTSTEWLKENPFGVQSDWERHVLARGAPMYRLMLFKR